MPQLLISAAHKSSGKTTLSIGLSAALVQRGFTVQTFKKGPDYIDPLWLGLASNRPCHNLDFYLSSAEEIKYAYSYRSYGSDFQIIEGNKGLYDGLDLDGSNSNAALATLLDTPVMLVINVQGMTRGIAPLILGYQQFEPNLNIAGVIFNQVRGYRHEDKLRAVVEHYTNVPVIGSVHHDPALEIVERHLGLMPSNESDIAKEKIARIADRITDQVDLDKLISVSGISPDTTRATKTAVPQKSRIRLGIAKDTAFGFYYPGDIEALEAAGADLIEIDTLIDQTLPEIDALFIGGGFPETQMEKLEQNSSLRTAIRNAIESGLPAYAECGGLMYLAREIRWRDKTCQMVGVIGADVLMHDTPVGRGYTRFVDNGNSPWGISNPDRATAEFPAHEFHYSSLENIDPDLEYAYAVKRGMGIDGKRDGIIYKNLLANYVHLRDVDQNHWAKRFIEFVRSIRNQVVAESQASL
ncbi:MAG: cobyrinate a,c-diamide synthase [Acidiferrobacterales bacterium]